MTHWLIVDPASGKMRPGPHHIQVLAANGALVTTTFEGAASDTAGHRVVTRPMWTAMWMKRNGAWKRVNVAEMFPPRDAVPKRWC